jgi:hypothetical protein
LRQSGNLTVRQLSAGWWHIRGNGPCNWAQPPTWPIHPDELEQHIFHEAGREFRRELAEANDRLWEECNGPRDCVGTERGCRHCA